MSIRDDEPPYAPRRTPSGRRDPAERHRQLVARRGVAAVIGLVVAILVVIGVRGCLDARTTRSYENFIADLQSLVTQTGTLSKGFFQHLQNPGGSKLTFQTELKTDAGTAASLATRAEDLSTPGQLSAAHSDLALAYSLRANALNGIAEELAGGKPDQASAQHVVAQMKQLLASDVVYSRAQSEIDNGLNDQGIAEKAPASQFLPDPQTKWLDVTTIAGILSGVGVSGGGGGGGSVSGVHGTGISTATLNGLTLTPNTPITVTPAPPNTLAVTVENQGQSTERNVQVSVKVSGGGSNTSKQTTIGSIAAGGTGTANVALGTVPSGSLTIDVKVAPVLGEHVTTNNNATYPVTFS